jgi:hypothetical protein
LSGALPGTGLLCAELFRYGFLPASVFSKIQANRALCLVQSSQFAAFVAGNDQNLVAAFFNRLDHSIPVYQHGVRLDPGQVDHAAFSEGDVENSAFASPGSFPHAKQTNESNGVMAKAKVRAVLVDGKPLSEEGRRSAS